MDLASGPTQNAALAHRNGPHHHLHAQTCNTPLHTFPENCHLPDSYGIPSGAAAEEQKNLPKVGQTRCYWVLLTTSLQFKVLDPVLRYHLEDQAAHFLECGLLDFVHPDEREYASRDLGNVLKERTLHGSVTRVRYCRLSRVRRLLGYSDSSLPYPPSFPAERIAVDEDYMAVYLVVNCVADGVVLCFIHAVVDIAPQADNDELHKTGWSNWCSTYSFDDEQANALYQRLCETALPIPRNLSDPSLRVLQILRNQTDRPLVLSWPPDSMLFQDDYPISIANCLAQLAQRVQLGYFSGSRGSCDARTSCTRRYKSVQSIELPTTGGSKIVHVESILIPHGMIIFACHKVNGAYRDMDRVYTSIQDHRYQEAEQTSRLSCHGIGDVRNQTFHSLTLASSQHDLTSQNYVQQWVDQHSQAQTLVQAQAQAHAHQRNYPLDDPKETFPPQEQWSNGLQTIDEHQSVLAGTSDSDPRPSFAVDVTSRSAVAGTVPPSTTSTIHFTCANDRGSGSPSHEGETPPSSGKDPTAKERIRSCGRGQGIPPTGVVSCAHCQITQSPEWRKGPSGKKDLCNACGLRFSRSRAKKEGIVSRKRRKNEKEMPSLNRHSRSEPDPGSATVIYNYLHPEYHEESAKASVAQEQDWQPSH